MLPRMTHNSNRNSTSHNKHKADKANILSTYVSAMGVDGLEILPYQRMVEELVIGPHPHGI